jgi:hypothetical protein
LIIRQFDLPGNSLSQALVKTFHHRNAILPKTPPFFSDAILDEKSDRQLLWAAFLKKNYVMNSPDKLAVVSGYIEKFISKHLRLTINETIGI